MTTYRIESDAGAVLGCYEGADESGALLALARDAGYRDYAAIQADVGGTVRVVTCEIAVRLSRGVVALHHDTDGWWRWYGRNGDVDVSGKSVADACRALLAAYPDSEDWTDEGTETVRAVLAREEVKP